MMKEADFKEKALESLKGKWGVAVGTGIVAALLGAGGGGTSFDFETSDFEALSGYVESEAAMNLLYAFVGVFAIIAVVVGLVYFIIGGAVELGYKKFNLNLVDQNGEARFNNLFSQFHRLGTGIVMNLLLALYTTLWSLLFLIPGIIKGYSYAMTPYILAENPQMSANQAITESRRLMDGNKWRLFCLSFSFIGWIFVCIFTMGIGFLWLIPYQEAAFAAFYREIKREKDGEPETERVVDVPETEAVTEIAEKATEESYEDMMANRYHEPEYRDMSYYETNQEKNENTDEN